MDIRNYEEYIQQSLKKPVPVKTSGIDPRAWISEIGGIIGGVGGGLATRNPAGAAAGAAGGTALGKILEQKIKGEPIKPTDLAVETGLAGVFGFGPIRAGKNLIGLARGGAKEAGKKVVEKGAAQAGKQTVKQAVKTAPKVSLPFQAYKTALGVDNIVATGNFTPRTILEADDLAREAFKAGIQGSPKRMQRQALAAYQTLGAQLTEKLSKSTKTMTLNQLTKEVKKGLADVLPAGKQYNIQLQNTLKQLKRFANPDGTFDAQSIYNFKNNLRVGRAFKKATGALQSDFTAKELVDLEIWKNTDDIIALLAPNAKATSRRMSKYYGLSQALAAQSRSNVPQSGTEALLTLVKPTVVSATTRGAQAIGAKEVTKKGAETGVREAGERFQQSLLRQAAGAGARQTAAGLSRGVLAPRMIEELPEEEGAGLPTGMEEAPAPRDPRLDVVARAILDDFRRTGGKNLKNIQVAAGIYGIDLTPIGLATTTKPTVDAATRRQLAAISTGSSIVDEIEDLYSQAGGGRGRVGGPLTSLVGTVGLEPAVRVYNNAVAAYISRLSRSLGEVGVLTDQDIERAKASVPKINDTPEEARRKLDSLRRIIQSAYNELEAQFE